MEAEGEQDADAESYYDEEEDQDPSENETPVAEPLPNSREEVNGINLESVVIEP